MSKISYSEYLELIRNPEITDEELLKYSKVEKGRGGFDFILIPNPDKVELSSEDLQFESAMEIGNGIARFRRQLRFKRRKLFGSKLPVLVEEGDSWHQFPFLIKEVVDQLGDNYLIWSVGAAGDTAENMVYGSKEYMKALLDNKDEVQAFLFSAAGNDIIGEDPVTQRAALFDLLKDYNGNNQDIEGHINLPLLEKKMKDLEDAYIKVIINIRKEKEFKKLPIIVHGYDYVFPYPWGDDDKRNPSYAKKNEWIGEPLDKHNFPHTETELRRSLIKYMLDQLYVMLEGLSETYSHVYVVDCRGAMPNLEDWADEIHGTSDGFKKVAVRFEEVLNGALKN